MAARSKFTPALALKFVELVRRGNFRETASAQVGIDARTFRGWLSKAAAGDARFQAFVVEVDAAEAAAEDKMVTVLYRAAEIDWRAASWILERRGSKRWGFRAQMAQTIDVRGPATPAEAAALVRVAFGGRVPSDQPEAENLVGAPEGSESE